MPAPERGLLLGIETSCDETSAAVVRGGGEVLSMVISSQSDLHTRYGGVVPELASRAHLEAILPAVHEVLDLAGTSLNDLEGVAVTRGPGLIGALLVGLTAAKAISFALGIPLLAVNHLEAHIYANFLSSPELEPPLVAFVVSGGHTVLVYMKAHRDYRVLGETLDDAAGEAYDKVARFLGLGYPGGPIIDRLAAQGDPRAVAFPRAMIRDGTYNFSLSGLKTAVTNHVRKLRQKGEEVPVEDIAASFQAAVVEVQVHKIVRASKEMGVKSVLLAGGVAANRHLRSELEGALAGEGVRLYYPPLDLCMDNAAMIASLGWRMLADGEVSPLDIDAAAVLPLDST
jgi:tRNA N6-adenosine threonylcarbamoyltransferase